MTVEQKPRRSTFALVVYFILGLFFALLTVLAKRPMQISYERMGAAIGIDTRWLFWVLLILSAICIMPLIAAILQNLSGQKKLPKFLEPLFQETSPDDQNRWLSNIQARLFGKTGLLFITGAAILLLCIFIAKTNAVDDDAINGQLYELVLRMQGIEPSKQSFSHVSSLVYLTGNRDSEQHLRDILAIVQRLKEAGARAVLVTLPQMPPEGKNTFALMKEIYKSGIVIWGFNHTNLASTQSKLADSIGGALPMMAYCSGEAEDLWKSPVLARLWRGDIPYALLEKYHNYQRHLYTTSLFGDEIEFGEHKIPLSKERWSYARDTYEGSGSFDIYVHQGEEWVLGGMVWGAEKIRSQRVTKYLGPVNSSVAFRYSELRRGPGAKGPWSPLMKTAFEERMRNRIVLLVGNYGNSQGNYVPDRAYAVWLESLLRGTLMRKPAGGYILFLVACLAIVGFLAYRFRPLVAVLLSFVLAIFVLILASYLYEGSNILVDIFYPLLATGIAMIVFPAIISTHRARDSGLWAAQ